jgi:alpha-galactosidase
MTKLLLAALLLLPICSIAQPASSPGPASGIRTPPAPAAPRINGPRIYGARPGRPFLYHLPVTGLRPLRISAKGLPAGLGLDSATGNITGAVARPGDYTVLFTAANSAGKDTASLRIVIGRNIALTPPLGWNSWNCFNIHIDDARIRAAADAMVSKGLIDHGWTYINVDDHWEGDRDKAGHIHSSAERLPDVKSLASYIHGKGLKIGLYSSPGPLTCGNVLGSYRHEDQDAATYAGWDIDYLKYDWCSYYIIAGMLSQNKYADLLPPDKSKQLKSLAVEKAVLALRNSHIDLPALPQTQGVRQAEAEFAGLTTADQVLDRLKSVASQGDTLQAQAARLFPARAAAIENETLQQPYRTMRTALDKVNRDIVFSFCQYGMGHVWEWGAAAGGNLWRTTSDISADWKTVQDRGFSQNGLEHWAGPGHWNDPDMLEIGNGNLTPDENYTHMTLWCMLSAPLLIGCDMPSMSPFIVSLFSNDEVLAVNQDSLGRQGWRASQDGEKEVWIKPLHDGSLAIAFFNRGDAPAAVSVQWSDIKLTGPQSLRDLWRQKDLGKQAAGYSVTVAAHGAELFKASP